jgi:Dimethyladenosine transferase (rRNA methylation)
MRWRDVSRRSREAPITARSRYDSNFITTLSICERFRAQFFPRPKSLRQLLRFTPRDEKRIGIFDPAVFREIVKHGFSQRRKQLRKLLASHVGDWECISKKIAVPLTARAEELSLKQWIVLANHIAPRDEKIAARASAERFPVVDENDRQIGTSSRPEVHENNFRHRAVHILIFNHSGRSCCKSVHLGKTGILCSGIRAQRVM